MIGRTARSFQVLGALLEREAASRRRAPVDAVLGILEPLFIIGVFSFAIWFLEKLPGYGSSRILFIATGIFPVYLFVHCARRMRIVGPRARFPVETPFDHAVVYVAFAILDYTLFGLILFTALYVFSTSEAAPSNIIYVVGSCSFVALMGFGVALINLAIRRVFPFWAYIFPALARLTMLFSAVHYVADHLPPSTRYIMSFNPLQHAIQLFRLGFYPRYPHIFLDVPYLAKFTLVVVALGLVVERLNRRGEAQ